MRWSAFQKAVANMVAPSGKRLGGPGTRKKNPARYDANKKEVK